MYSHQEDVSVSVDGGSTVTSATTLLSYTVPAGMQARLRHVTLFHNVGAPTIQLQVIRGGLTLVLEVFAAGSKAYYFPLNAGDQVRLQTTVGVASGSADAMMAVEQFS